MIVPMIRRAMRERVLYPVASRALEYILRRSLTQDERAGLASTVTHALLETTPALELRVQIAEALLVAGPYLGPKSTEFLILIDEIAQKHSPEVN